MKQFIFVLSLCFVSSLVWADTTINIKSATASSVCPADSASYEPQNAIDNKNSTAWFPKRTRKANQGEWIKLEFEEPSIISGVDIINGWIESKNNWRHNSRVKSAVITLSSGVTQSITLKDVMSVQHFSIPESEATWLKITIEEIYPGNVWNQESGLTQINVLGTTKEQIRLAALKKEKAAEMAKIEQLNAKKQAQAKADYLIKLQNMLDEKTATLSSIDFSIKASDLFKSEAYPEAKDIISQHIGNILQTSLDTYSETSDASALISVYDTYHKSIFRKAHNDLIYKIFKTAFEFDFSKAKKFKSSEQLLAVYKLYGSYYDENPFSQLVDLALEIDSYNIKKNPNAESDVSLLNKYQHLAFNEQQQTEYQTLIGLVLNQKLKTVDNNEQLAELLNGFKAFELNIANKKLINNSILNLSGIRFRETFREGKIGERYVPVISKSQSYNETRYINGVAINETKFNDYTEGGYDESRFGYTAVYQLFNESAQTYLVDVEISATVSNTEYKKKSSWSGPDRNVEIKKNNVLVKKLTYVLKANSELKDQIIVGEKKPSDFMVSVLNITPVDSEWFNQLSVAMDGDDIGLTTQYFFDDKALFWKPDVAGNLARQIYMSLDKTIITGDKFDRDFTSPVQVVFTNHSATAITLTYRANFMEQARTVNIKGNSEFKDTVNALGRNKDELKVTVEMLEPWI
ncbi:discoidin domain-containing protein [Shewanella sp.]|uniref:discoidin domain-containing protein n=1 Tax=Shewanella sp. TaxID=50422 RepID=UPI0035697B1D